MKFILGKKIEMSQFFDESGKVIPVTLIEAGPCWITQIKTKDKDKYDAVQIGFEKIESKKRLKKTQKGKEYRYIKEFSAKEARHERGSPEAAEIGEYELGKEINISVFEEGGQIRISGISKGKGFQGAVKRWGFHGRNATHGVKHEQRTLGSVGSAYPQRVIKGKKMPGRMGSERITVKNLKIVKIDKDANLLAVKGAVPGRRGTLLEIYEGTSL